MQLKDYSKIKDKQLNAGSIENFLLESMVNFTGIDNEKLSKDFLRAYLKAGKCLVLLDALDEVDNSDQDYLADLIISFFKNCNKNNKVCFTTRDRAEIPETPTVLKVIPIKIVEVESYLKLMVKLSKFKSDDIPTFISHCGPLIESGFLTNFLMVALMVQIFEAERRLPENKLDLYDKCVEYISRTREVDEKKVGYDFSLIKSVLDKDLTFESLSELCKWTNKECEKSEIENVLLNIYNEKYSDENKALNAISHFLKFCTERTELFVLSNTNKNLYKFYHRSFFEYFFAKHLINVKESNEELLESLLNFNKDSEIFELTFSILKDKHYTRFKMLVRYLLDGLSNGEIEPNSSIMNIITELMNLTDEYHFLEKFYNLCFGESRLLEKYDYGNNWRRIYSILLNYYKKSSFVGDFKKFYSKNFLAGVSAAPIFNSDIVIGYLSDPVFRSLIDLIDKNDQRVKLIAKKITKQKFSKIINEHLLFHNDPEDEEESSVDFGKLYETFRDYYSLNVEISS